MKNLPITMRVRAAMQSQQEQSAAKLRKASVAKAEGEIDYKKGEQGPKTKDQTVYESALAKNPNLNKLIKQRNAAEKGSAEYAKAQNAINAAYGVKKRYTVPTETKKVETKPVETKATEIKKKADTKVEKIEDKTDAKVAKIEERKETQESRKDKRDRVKQARKDKREEIKKARRGEDSAAEMKKMDSAGKLKKEKFESRGHGKKYDRKIKAMHRLEDRADDKFLSTIGNEAKKMSKKKKERRRDKSDKLQERAYTKAKQARDIRKGAASKMKKMNSPADFNAELKKAANEGKLDNNPKFKAAVLEGSPAQLRSMFLKEVLKRGGSKLSKIKDSVKILIKPKVSKTKAPKVKTTKTKVTTKKTGGPGSGPKKGGVYKDTAQNRKLGRVGKPYAPKSGKTGKSGTGDLKPPGAEERARTTFEGAKDSTKGGTYSGFGGRLRLAGDIGSAYIIGKEILGKKDKGTGDPVLDANLNLSKDKKKGSSTKPKSSDGSSSSSVSTSSSTTTAPTTSRGSSSISNRYQEIGGNRRIKRRTQRVSDRTQLKLAKAELVKAKKALKKARKEK